MHQLLKAKPPASPPAKKSADPEAGEDDQQSSADKKKKEKKPVKFGSVHSGGSVLVMCRLSVTLREDRAS